MEIPYEKTIADLFRWRVSESGDEIAHKFLDTETTYKELDSYANKVSPVSYTHLTLPTMRLV